MLAFGVAIAFKLQAIFLAPVLLALALRGTIPWRWSAIVPAALFLGVLPSWIAGRPLGELLNIYFHQASQFEVITMNAASAYAWLPGSKQVFNLFYQPGVVMGAAAAFLWCAILYKSPRRLLGPFTLEVALVAMLVVPFFLPKMHDRYFYPADILSIPLAFFYPELFYIPILVGGVSFLSYQPFLFERDLVALPILTTVLLISIGILFYHSMVQLYAPSTDERLIEGAGSGEHHTTPKSIAGEPTRS
jgi:Gpi18-like mannosyltransferase